MGAAGIILKTGAPPVARLDGGLAPIEESDRLSDEDIKGIAGKILAPYDKTLSDLGELDIGYTAKGVGRFRCNLYRESGRVGIVFRVLAPSPMSFEELNLPEILEKISLEERGLVLVTGTTGSGKSTTLAAMIDYINHSRSRHIITIEDPIEFVFEDDQSLITQRQLGVDTATFADALRASLRQDPDVILIGEMRDKETIDTAVMAAETGHLVFSTLHTLDAIETINRILAVFPSHQQEQMRGQLADLLRAVISMRLLPRADNTGLVPAVEVLINTRFIAECVKDHRRSGRIRDAMAEGNVQYGMQTFDQSLLGLHERGMITKEVALAAATNSNDLSLRMRGIVSGIDAGKKAIIRPGPQETI